MTKAGDTKELLDRIEFLIKQNDWGTENYKETQELFEELGRREMTEKDTERFIFLGSKF